MFKVMLGVFKVFSGNIGALDYLNLCYDYPNSMG